MGGVKAFEYERAEAVADGVRAIAAGARAMAGGTDLMPLMREGTFGPDRIVDISQADAGLRRIEGEGGGIRIGALVTLSEIAADARVRREFAALAESAESAATPQIRNMATIGGNLCQWNRCWYFRSHVPCHLNGADDCPAAGGDNRFHAIFRDGPCIAVHPSDPAVALLAMGAIVVVHGPQGGREVSLSDFLRRPAPGRPDQADLAAGEIVTEVRVPAPRGRSRFLKAMERRAWAFALVSVAVVVDRDADGRVGDAAIALGGVAGVPVLALTSAAVLKGAALTPEQAERAADAAVQDAEPFANNAYKVDLTRRMIRTALLELAAHVA